LKPAAVKNHVLTTEWQYSLNLLDGIAILHQKNVIKYKLEGFNGLQS